MRKKTVRDVNLDGKKVLLRADFNVPMSDGEITDDNRIKMELPNIEYILAQNAKLIVCSHLGKVKTEEDKNGKSLEKVAKRLSELLHKEVKFINKTRGKELESAIIEMKPAEIIMFENTRFEKGETTNESELGEYWASLADIFVNDAFGTAHREHASNVGISKHLETVSGFLMEKEIKFLSQVEKSEKPLVAILGGAKVSDKIKVIENLIDKADKIIIGGGMMFTFLKSKGYEIGNSIVEDEKLELAKSIIQKAKKANVELILPVDVVVANEFKNDASIIKTVEVDKIPSDMMGLDIGEKTILEFRKAISDAKTIIWNGPMGVFEMPNFAKGTISMCQMIAALKQTTSIIGGGDSAAAALSTDYSDAFTHISTGGGASLEFLEGKKLPGIESISNL